MTPVLDLSNHDFPTLNEACLAANGVERAIIGCWDFAVTSAIVTRLRAVGIVVEDLYAEVYNGTQYELREGHNAIAVQNALGGIERIWIAQEVDAQFEAPNSTPSLRLAATDRMDDLVRPHFPVLPGIYTYDFYWRYKVANDTSYSNRLLWNSRPGTNDPNNPVPPIRVVSYGGWTLCDIHQYSSTIVVCGRVRDHNYWFLEDEEMGMTPQETAWVQSLANKIAVLEAIVAGNGIDTDGDGVPDTFGQAALDYAYNPQNGWSAFLGVTNNARDLSIHIQDGGEVFDHKHDMGGPIVEGSNERATRDLAAATVDTASLFSGTRPGDEYEGEPDRGPAEERFNRE